MYTLDYDFSVRQRSVLDGHLHTEQRQTQTNRILLLHSLPNGAEPPPSGCQATRLNHAPDHAPNHLDEDDYELYRPAAAASLYRPAIAGLYRGTYVDGDNCIYNDAIDAGATLRLVRLDEPVDVQTTAKKSAAHFLQDDDPIESVRFGLSARTYSPRQSDDPM